MKISLIIVGLISLIGIDICSTDIEPLSILERRNIYKANGYYHYCISAFENDEMSIDIKIKDYFYFSEDYFQVYIKGFSGPIDSSKMEDDYGYTFVPLGKTIKDDDCSIDCIFRYPFSTISGVDYLSFRLYTTCGFNIEIYVRSEKAETAIGIIAVIIIAIILVIAGIGALATFLLRKFGCWVRIHSSSI